MAGLCAQSIRTQCLRPWENQYALDNPQNPGDKLPMISPYVDGKVIRHGMSYGLSAASYDLRIAHDLTLGPHPGFFLSHALRGSPDGFSATTILNQIREWVAKSPPPFALAHTIEDFAIPTNVRARICDKSSYARLHVSALNTLFDPGFRGNATLELVNLSDQPVVLRAGDPVCQIVFEWLDHSTDRSYDGKYQDQPKKIVGAIYEGTE